jgi:hypothetical protein
MASIAFFIYTKETLSVQDLLQPCVYTQPIINELIRTRPSMTTNHKTFYAFTRSPYNTTGAPRTRKIFKMRVIQGSASAGSHCLPSSLDAPLTTLQVLVRHLDKHSAIRSTRPWTPIARIRQL